MSRFFSLKIKALGKESNDCTVLTFEMPEKLRSAFAYKAGQHLTLRAHVSGEEVRRSYSLCSAPHEGQWRVAIKRVEGGAFSNFANDVLRVGDDLEAMPPMGRFTHDAKPGQPRHYVAIAAGSGITPIMAIAKNVLENEPNSCFSLLYGNKSVGNILFREVLEGLKNKYIDRLELLYFLTREQTELPLFNGRIDHDKLSTIFGTLIDPAEVDAFYLCGPEDLIFSSKDFLTEKGVPSEKVHFELFTPVGAKRQAQQGAPAPKMDGASCHVTVKDGGKTFTFDLPIGTDALLDAALKQGADLPFACKGGVCGTCKARLLEGEVDMPINYALESDEISAGYILACQAFPKSEKLTLDFDQAL